jgi:serine/threonine-protein kinase
MAADPKDPLIGRRFDRRYTILRKLGSGGMAEVYLAEDDELGRNVALKMLNERHARDDQFVERFKREARNAARLSHPHIVRVYDRGEAEGTYYISMEYLDGPTLKELLVRKGPTPPLTAIKFAREILSALGEAHKHDIVHRDIKPHNVIVSPDWNVKVTDFGIARSGASQMTEAGSIVGTAQYLSPEQARGKPVDPRSDLYSLGIVMYEMLTGKVPFTGDAAVEIAMKHLSAVPDPPSKLRPEISHDLDAIVMRALAKDPDQRYASAEEMDADLARVARGAAVSHQTEEAMTQVLRGEGATSALTAIVPRSAVATPPPAPPAYRPPSFYEERSHRSRWPLVLGFVAVVIAAVGGYLIYKNVTTIDTSKTVTVIDVGGLLQGNAVLKLQQQGLGAKVVPVPSDTVLKGFVISQSPTPGTKRAKGFAVTLQVSSGKPRTVVPTTLIGETLQQAESDVAHAHLTYRQRSVPSKSVPSGSVTATHPTPGTTVLEGTVVTLNVSTGPKEIPVPDVVGDPYQNGVGALEGQGFKTVRRDVSSAEPDGNIVAESPSAETSVAVGTTITLSVSKGPKVTEVPSLTGDDAQTAVQLITQDGFTPSVTYDDVTEPSQDGIVLTQSPSGGSLPQGGTITITVGRLVNETTTESTSTDTTTTQTTPTTSTTETTTPTTSTTSTATTSTTTAPTTLPTTPTTPTTSTTPPAPPAPPTP